MATTNTLADLAAVLHPLPKPVDPEPDGWSEVVDDVRQARQDAQANWEASLDAGHEYDDGGMYDPVLDEIAGARREVLEAEHRLRLLLAYAREFVGPRPYTLAELARFASMSISGVRTAYSNTEVVEVARRTGHRARRPLLADTAGAVGTDTGDVDAADAADAVGAER